MPTYRRKSGPSSNAELFEAKTLEPLAARMRPTSLDEFAGQEHLLGPGKPLRDTIERGTVSSMIFWGPPGSGKTTLARLIARYTDREFVAFQVVPEGVRGGGGSVGEGGSGGGLAGGPIPLPAEFT